MPGSGQKESMTFPLKFLSRYFWLLKELWLLNNCRPTGLRAAFSYIKP